MNLTVNFECQIRHVKFIDKKGNVMDEMLFDRIINPQENENIDLKPGMETITSKICITLEEHEKAITGAKGSFELTHISTFSFERLNNSSFFS